MQATAAAPDSSTQESLSGPPPGESPPGPENPLPELPEWLPPAVTDVWQTIDAHPLLAALLIVIGAFLVAKLTELVLVRGVARLTRRTQTEVDDQLIGLLHRPIFIAVFFFGLALAVRSLGLPAAFNVGDIQKELLLGASNVGQEALTRFYLLHIMVLPIVFVGVLAVHIWRIRKDGGIARPEGTPTAAGKGVALEAAELRETETVRKELSDAAHQTKTYGLMAVVPDTSPHTGKEIDETVPSWPYLLRAEILVFMLTMLACLVLGMFFDAPLKEIANPAVPENPAKAPWYFLGLQEMVSYSAFVGGILIPAIAMIGLGLIPYLDREKEASGVWFSGKRGKRVAGLSAAFAAIAAILAVAIPVNFGWLREWYPNIPQIVIIVINPGCLLAAAYAGWSLLVIIATKSTRMGAIALFTCFLVGFVILTYVGTSLRGPNWDFFWSKSSWPIH